MALVPFFYTARRRGEFVIITRSLSITITAALVDKLHLNQYEAVKLYSDDTDPILVLEFLTERSIGAFPVVARHAFEIPAKRFLAQLDAKPGHYEADWDPEKRQLVCCYSWAISVASNSMA